MGPLDCPKWQFVLVASDSFVPARLRFQLHQNVGRAQHVLNVIEFICVERVYIGSMSGLILCMTVGVA